ARRRRPRPTAGGHEEALSRHEGRTLFHPGFHRLCCRRQHLFFGSARPRGLRLLDEHPRGSRRGRGGFDPRLPHGDLPHLHGHGSRRPRRRCSHRAVPPGGRAGSHLLLHPRRGRPHHPGLAPRTSPSPARQSPHTRPAQQQGEEKWRSKTSPPMPTSAKKTSPRSVGASTRSRSATATPWERKTPPTSAASSEPSAASNCSPASPPLSSPRRQFPPRRRWDYRRAAKISRAARTSCTVNDTACTTRKATRPLARETTLAPPRAGSIPTITATTPTQTSSAWTMTWATGSSASPATANGNPPPPSSR